jgi:hypothetical protein
LEQAAFLLQQALKLAPADEGIQRNLAKVRADLGEVEAGGSTAMMEVAVVGAKGAAVGEDEDSFSGWNNRRMWNRAKIAYDSRVFTA